ncbi:hypothetical protein [Citrobacter freundii]|uniref:hypothetical protein n=1 Tax=Citrobacter freundii TaxID=546 RepID=UPI0028BF2920|nr:hypothetical protein [Citrobacter freundii]MDT7328849.1 hypothetical protein [Citrobacter freundii]MDT7401612.1 hypothetical protein [Citrobacter freundii]MDV1747449.1 hypothetical protein [Citrobacter freundii]MEB0445228.1 hypothetical protein [Citrobacter freundii]HBV7989641.1 hypothetical protein [Citrobacter freundii]
MSQNISQLRPSKPVDCTLPRHGMFRHTEDDKWQINLYMLFKKLPKPRGSRAIWYKTSQNMVQKLPADIFGREIREIGAVFHDEIDRNTLITASSALVLLTYGSLNHKHLEVTQWVERYTGITLPRHKGLSRREAVFGRKLHEFIDKELVDITYGDYELKTQQRMCNGKFYVDFAVKHYWNGNEDSSKYYLYLIEFDEEEHALAPNQAADSIRDSEIKRQEPQATIIRVKHDESDDWFELVRNNNGLISFEAALLSGISAASRGADGDKIIIDSKSAKNAYDDIKNQSAWLLNYEKQPLRGIEEALKRCGIHYEKARSKTSRQLRVSLESLSSSLYRWLPDSAAEYVLQNLKPD